jgi:hypothetical protein
MIQWLQKSVFKLIEEVRLLCLAIIFIVGVLFFAFMYYEFTPVSNGIGVDGVAKSDLCIWDAIYFSTVTISSLGYGDFHPMGCSKIFAALEVLFGLFIMGIMLAKLTSARLAYHVRKLYGSEIQRQLNSFITEMNRTYQYLRDASRELSEAFLEIPGHRPRLINKISIPTFNEALINFNSIYAELNDLILFEGERGDFFSNAPPKTLKRIAENIDQALFLLTQIIIGLPATSRIEVLNIQNRKMIGQIRDSVENICAQVIKLSKNQDIKDSFSHVRFINEGIPASFYAITEDLEDLEQPDQKYSDEGSVSSELNKKGGKR